MKKSCIDPLGLCEEDNAKDEPRWYNLSKGIALAEVMRHPVVMLAKSLENLAQQDDFWEGIAIALDGREARRNPFLGMIYTDQQVNDFLSPGVNEA